MKIVTWNVNGIRSTFDPHFKDFLNNSPYDLVCIQETKAHPEQLDKSQKAPNLYISYFSSAEKKGYSGTGVYTLSEPSQVLHEIGLERFDKEGRFLRLDFEEFTLINVYIPHGKHDKSDLDYKLEVYRSLGAYINALRDRKIILTGDLNIARTPLDVALDENNKDSTMFTPKERRTLEDFLDIGFTDTFRELHPNKEQFTFWSYTNSSREKNLGWRIDYILVSNSLKDCINECTVLDDVYGSDHCPVLLDIDLC